VYTLDTNTIIYYLDNDPAVVSVLDPIFAQGIAELTQLLTSVVVFPLESRLAQLASALRRQYRLKTPDSVVAATAVLTRTTLVTRNIRDFQGIAGLSLLPI